MLSWAQGRHNQCASLFKMIKNFRIITELSLLNSELWLSLLCTTRCITSILLFSSSCPLPASELLHLKFSWAVPHVLVVWQAGHSVSGVVSGPTSNSTSANKGQECIFHLCPSSYHWLIFSNFNYFQVWGTIHCRGRGTLEWEQGRRCMWIFGDGSSKWLQVLPLSSQRVRISTDNKRTQPFYCVAPSHRFSWHCIFSFFQSLPIQGTQGSLPANFHSLTLE